MGAPGLPKQMQTDAQDRSRAYKSRNKRPCDFCRYKKAACHLEADPPCELCIRYGKECTFVESPAKRRRPNEERRSSEILLPTNNNFDISSELLSWEQQLPPFLPPSLHSDFTFDPPVYEPLMFEQFDPVQAGLAPPANDTPQSLPLDPSCAGEPSLDSQTSSHSQVVGLSGEQDPYLLRHYRFDGNNEFTFQQIRMRRVGENDSVPVHFMIQQNKLAAKAQPAENPNSVDTWRREIKDIVNDGVGKRLIKLFFRYIQPYFPILSRERSMRDGEFDPDRIATPLLAAIYGHALPFCIFDDQLCVEVYTPPSPDALFTLAWTACIPQFHIPSLAVVQTLLLLVQRRPTNRHVADTPFKWIIMTNAVSISQALGLNLDPADWPLPIWELKLRKRVAWALYSQEKWLSLNFGRSSHISADDWDVNPLTFEDFEENDQGIIQSEYFLRLCVLAEIVDEILRNLFSLKSTRKLCNSLESTLEVAKPLRLKLAQWYKDLDKDRLSPANDRKAHDLNGEGSLHLAYITAKIELFRAMLRPRGEANVQAGAALRQGAISLAKEMFEFLDALDVSHLEAFWPSYSRTNFTIASNFMVLLFATAPTLTDANECLQLLGSWRSLLRLKSRSCDLLNLALLRLDALYVAGVDKLIELSPSALQAFQEQSIMS
ncbi:hypothetical protein AAFC00_005803 [Neodothiora populina]